MDLKAKTTAELLALELVIREEKERRASKEAELVARGCSAKLDILLEYIVKHTRTSCSDENRANACTKNGIPRCIRCFLLDCQDQEYVPPLSDFGVDVRITVKQ